MENSVVNAAGKSDFESKVVADTTQWLEKVVIGLNLCPFAKPVHMNGLIRFVVSPATTNEALLVDLRRELLFLVETAAEVIETTLLIHPGVLADFLDYNAFLEDSDRELEELELDGVIQIASFHPDYRFAGAKMSDVTNGTNRSPFPMLHLLREESVTRALDGYANPERIYERNMAALRSLGKTGLEALLKQP